LFVGEGLIIIFSFFTSWKSDGTFIKDLTHQLVEMDLLNHLFHYLWKRCPFDFKPITKHFLENAARFPKNLHQLPTENKP